MKVYIVFRKSVMRIFESKEMAFQYYEALRIMHPDSHFRLEGHDLVKGVD